MKMKPSPFRGFLVAGLLAVSAGCGDDLGLTEVSGVVTLDGKPVPNATVTFTPKGGDGSPSYGTTDADGSYGLRFSRDREGVLPGIHDVTVTVDKLGKADAEALRAEGEEVRLHL